MLNDNGILTISLLLLNAIACSGAQVNILDNGIRIKQFNKMHQVSIIGLFPSDSSSMNAFDAVAEKVILETLAGVGFAIVVDTELQKLFVDNRTGTPDFQFPALVAQVNFDVDGTPLPLGAEKHRSTRFPIDLDKYKTERKTTIQM